MIATSVGVLVASAVVSAASVGVPAASAAVLATPWAVLAAPVVVLAAPAVMSATLAYVLAAPSAAPVRLCPMWAGSRAGERCRVCHVGRMGAPRPPSVGTWRG
ncbi:hypothetical protein ACWEOA_32930 [Streptomyces sp. NPDC004457]